MHLHHYKQQFEGQRHQNVMMHVRALKMFTKHPTQHFGNSNTMPSHSAAIFSILSYLTKTPGALYKNAGREAKTSTVMLVKNTF